MDSDCAVRLQALEKKVDAVLASSEKTRKYFLWTLVITVAAILLPLIGLFFVIPQFLNTYSSNLPL